MKFLAMLLLWALQIASPVSASAPEASAYATIDEADVIDGVARLRGHFSDRCGRLREVKIRYDATTIYVEPLLDISIARDCSGDRAAFLIEEPLPSELRGMYLLSVRSGERTLSKLVELGE